MGVLALSLIGVFLPEAVAAQLDTAFRSLPANLSHRSDTSQHRSEHGRNTSSERASSSRRLADGGITLNLFGEDTVKYFVGAHIVSGGRGLILTAEPFMKVTLMNSPMTTSTNPADFAYLKLSGNSLKVGVNMGNPGPSCGCNVAFFLVSMPSTSPGQYGDFYCDANCVGGNCCPEFDLIEMNTHALQVTNHQCSNYHKPPTQYSSSECDHGGSPIVKFAVENLEFGPGDHFTINSQRPFEFRMDFPIEAGVLQGHVTLSQSGKMVTHTMGNLESIRGALSDGMALVLDAWEATDMTWLDGGSCGNPSYCNKQATVFDNIVISSLDGTHPSPHPTPAPSPNPSQPQVPRCDCGWANAGTCIHDDSTVCFQMCCCNCDWANAETCQQDDGSACFHACCYAHNEVSFDMFFASSCWSPLHNHISSNLLVWLIAILMLAA